MKLKDLLFEINKSIPFAIQEEYDNSGLLIGNPDTDISKGIICLDITEDVLDEAISEKCDVIISHHPLIFKGLKKITGVNYTERIIVKAIKNDIAIIAVHTNVDNYFSGVNFKLAQKIGLKDMQILLPKNGILKKLIVFCPASHADIVRNAIFDAGAGRIGNYDSCSFNIEGKGSFRPMDGTNPFVGEIEKLHIENEVRIETIIPSYLQNIIINKMIEAHPYEEVAFDIIPINNEHSMVGAGMIGNLENKLSEHDFMDLIKTNLNVPMLKHSRFLNRMISKVAICGGSGSFLLENAINKNADAFITADIKYNLFFEAENNLMLIDAGHFETEQFTSEVLFDIISKKFTNFALQISKKQYNSVHYY
jgi:dinuclear metal center YbgI/SA1388 family protein